MYGFHMHFGVLWCYEIHINIASLYKVSSKINIVYNISLQSHSFFEEKWSTFHLLGLEGQRSTQKAFLKGCDKLHLCWMGPQLKEGCKG